MVLLYLQYVWFLKVCSCYTHSFLIKRKRLSCHTYTIYSNWITSKLFGQMQSYNCSEDQKETMLYIVYRNQIQKEVAWSLEHTLRNGLSLLRRLFLSAFAIINNKKTFSKEKYKFSHQVLEISVLVFFFFLIIMKCQNI